MITIRHAKCRNGETFETSSLTVTQEEALNRYLLPELVRGGNVIELEQATLTTSTKYRGGYVNKYIFTGSYESMRELYTHAGFWVDASTKYSIKSVEQTFLAEKFLVNEDEVRESPFVELLVPSTIGNKRLRIAAMLAARITDQDEIEIGLKVTLEEFFAAIKRTKEGMEAFPAHMLMPH